MNKITSINGTLLASLNELNEHVENGTAHVTEDERTAWNAKATVKAQGILIATQENLDEHAGNKVVHLTEEERTTWNAKADASALSTKTDTSVFDAHKNDAVAHITGKERETWNGKQDKLMDEAGNITLPGNLTTQNLNVAGSLTAVQDTTNLGNVITANMIVQGMDVYGPGTFNKGVTMTKTLNVVGKVTVDGHCDVSNNLTFRSTQGGYISSFYNRIVFEGAGYEGGGDELTVQFESGNNIIYCNVRKLDAKPESLDAESMLNRKEGDARWLKFNNTLTDAQYAALQVKDQTTLYITSDGGKVYMGSHALN